MFSKQLMISLLLAGFLFGLSCAEPVHVVHCSSDRTSDLRPNIKHVVIRIVSNDFIVIEKRTIRIRDFRRNPGKYVRGREVAYFIHQSSSVESGAVTDVVEGLKLSGAETIRFMNLSTEM